MQIFVCRNDGHAVPVAIELGSPGSAAASQPVVYTPKSVAQVCLIPSCVSRQSFLLLCIQCFARCCVRFAPLVWLSCCMAV